MAETADYRKNEEGRKKLLELFGPGKDRKTGALFEPGMVRESYIDGSEGALKVFHFNYGSNEGKRPVVFVPGWGTGPEGFVDFFRMIYGKTECFFVETREKNSSRLPGKGAAMDMDRNALDLKEILEQLGFNGGRDFVLMGTCWGATVVSHALAMGMVSPPTAVVFDPMARLWFPKWLLKTVVPLIPVSLWKVLRPLGRTVALWGMEEETQRKRAESFINGADLHKWKKAAIAVRDYNLFDFAPRISCELFVFTGVADKIHDQSRYPEFVAALQNGRFFYLPVEESDREFLLGLIAGEFSLIGMEGGVPGKFREFEVEIG